MRSTYFTPGPAELYPSVERHFREAFEQQIGSISHRSQRFRDLYQFADAQLRQLLQVPDYSAILFTSSANEIWERLLMNTVEEVSFHLVNGAFSEKLRDFSTQLGLRPITFQKPLGEGFFEQEIQLPAEVELLACTANETATGVQMRPEDIHALKRRYPQTLVTVDMVSSAPYPDLDLSLVDSAYFSVQKSFGMPAGLGVWIVSPTLLEKSKKIQAQTRSVGTYHSLPVLWKNYEKFETPETPNVLFIYVLGKVAEDMNRLGIKTIRQETEQKAKMLYDFLEETEGFAPAVKEIAHRSQTVVVADVPAPAPLLEKAKKQGLIIGSGYGAGKASQLRIANFPAVSQAQVAQLIEVLRTGI
jgi:phosphoserine aminotransferase